MTKLEELLADARAAVVVAAAYVADARAAVVVADAHVAYAVADAAAYIAELKKQG